MTTINDQIAKLEETDKALGGVLRSAVEVLGRIAETQEGHTAMLKSIVSALQEQSIEIKLIKEHIG